MFKGGWVYYLAIIGSLASYTLFLIEVLGGRSSILPGVKNSIWSNEVIFMILIVTIIFALLIWILHATKLEFRIDSSGVQLSFYPFFKQKLISYSEIETWKVRKSNPILEFGGYGYRWNFFKRSKTFIIKGNMLLHMKLKNGKSILVGTQKPNMVKDSMESMFKY